MVDGSFAMSVPEHAPKRAVLRLRPLWKCTTTALQASSRQFAQMGWFAGTWPTRSGTIADSMELAWSAGPMIFSDFLSREVFYLLEADNDPEREALVPDEAATVRSSPLAPAIAPPHCGTVNNNACA